MPVDPAELGPLALSASLRPPTRRTVVLGARNEALAAFADEPVPEHLRAGRTLALSGPAARARTAAFGPQNVVAARRTRRALYGRARAPGHVVFAHRPDGTGVWHVVIAFATHEIDAMEEVWVEDAALRFDPAPGFEGEVAPGDPLRGWVRIFEHLGADGQAADPRLAARTDLWTDAHRLRGVAYLYLQASLLSSKFPNDRLPNVTTVARGKRLFDPRDGGTRWSDLPALAVRDYLADARYGLAVPDAAIDDGMVAEAADACEAQVPLVQASAELIDVDPGEDELVLKTTLDLPTGTGVQVSGTGTLPAPLAADTTYFWIRRDDARGGLAATRAAAFAGDRIDIADAGSGTHTVHRTSEPRYRLAGTIDTADAPATILSDMLAAMDGTLVFSGGRWRLRAGGWQAPVATIGEPEMIAPPRLRTRRARRDLVNRVEGTYTAPGRSWQETDLPPAENDAYEAADGGAELTGQRRLALVASHAQGQRLLKIALERSRRQESVELAVRLTALELRAGDVFALDYPRQGWTGKTFRVRSLALVRGRDGAGQPLIFVRLHAEAVDAGIWAWDPASDEQALSDVRRVQVNPTVTRISYDAGAEDARVTGLRLENASDAAGRTFAGPTASFVWRARGADVDGLDPAGAGRGARDRGFSHYQVTVEGPDGTVRRRERVLDVRYDYTLERNQADGLALDHANPAPARAFTVDVRAVTVDGRVSGRGARLRVSNPVPAVARDLTVTASGEGEAPAVRVTFRYPRDDDRLGAFVWMSAQPGFVPSEANLASVTTDEAVSLPARPNTAYRLRVGVFDGFGRTGLNVSAEMAVTTPGGFAGAETVGGVSLPWDVAAVPQRALVLSGDVTLEAPTSVTDGEVYDLEVVQDAAGGHAVTFAGAGYEFPAGDDGIAAAAGAVTHLSCEGRGGKLRCVAQPDFRAQGT